MNSSIRKRQAFSIGLGISSVAIAGLFAVSFLHAFNIGSNSASATSSSSASVDVNVDVAPTITISTDVSAVNLNVDTSNFGNLVSGSVVVDVGTNNYTGYTLSLASSSSNTALLKDGTSTTLTIPTLPSSTTASTWSSDSSLNNRWGFTHNNNGSDPSTGQIPAGTYLPIVAANTSGDTTIKVTDTAASTSNTTVTFTTKVDEFQTAGAYSNTVVLSATANANPDIYMQDFTAAKCNALTAWGYNSTTGTVIEGDTITLWDKRDNNSYKVRKLADGKCWMVENFNLSAESLTAAGHSTTLDYTDTDLTQGTTFAVPATSNTNWGGDSYPVEPKIATSNVSGYTDYGMYYNWWAATARTTDITTSGTDAPDSICPKGWHLPTGTASGELRAVIAAHQAAYGFTTLHGSGNDMSKINPTNNLANDTVGPNLQFSGYWSYAAHVPTYQLSRGFWWSSTVFHESNSYTTFINSDGGVYAGSNDNGSGKRYGFSLRCLLNTGENQ